MAPSNSKKERKKERKRSRLPPDEIPQREIIPSQKRDIKVGKREPGNKNFSTNEGGLKKLSRKGMPTQERIRREWRSPPREFLKMKVATIIQSGPSGRQCLKNGFHCTERRHESRLGKHLTRGEYIYIFQLLYLYYLFEIPLFHVTVFINNML
ncbi:hypothetical protein CEXT_170321 [Caerostris extrusa]|uniref:Uncharacterized protein n=1 Tax=Caerostris extrusa TaxID=172846 RepID=A0AAV4VUC6_CAEEX|nr:hypothetical protein CEXT_170321 [Caerostris extrusa]